jgi:hypothetical protein
MLAIVVGDVVLRGEVETSMIRLLRVQSQR